MKKYSKSNIKKRNFIKVLIGLFVVLVILSIALLLYVLLNNNVVYEKVNDDSKFVSVDVAKNSTPVIIDNVLVGGVYEKKWVSPEMFYLNSQNKANIDMDVYTKKGKKGTYSLTSISQGNSSTVYSAVSDVNLIDEYFAISKNETIDAVKNPATKKLTITEKEIDCVKDALGIYRLFNTSVKITQAYNVALSQGDNATVIFATNESGKSSGVYSAVVYVDNTGKSKLLKYNYVRNTEDASNWPVYSFKFIGDLNLDGVSEIIIQETKEFEVKYDVIEFKNNKFSEVLSTVIK